MFICIAGNVETEKVLKHIEEKILNLEPTHINRIMPEEPKEVVKPFVEQKLAVAQPIFCFGFKGNAEKTLSVKEKICNALLIEIIAGDASPLYKRLVEKELINDEFSSEHFNGFGYSSIIFEGESNNPQMVAEEIKNEVERLKQEGIDKKLFSAVRCGMYGNAIRLFNNVESIAMQLVECAMNDSELFDEIKYLKSVKLEDVTKVLMELDVNKTVLSVINPSQEV
jgi:predicted Zn-dependent peptidase